MKFKHRNLCILSCTILCILLNCCINKDNPKPAENSNNNPLNKPNAAALPSDVASEYFKTSMSSYLTDKSVIKEKYFFVNSELVNLYLNYKPIFNINYIGTIYYYNSLTYSNRFAFRKEKNSRMEYFNAMDLNNQFITDNFNDAKGIWEFKWKEQTSLTGYTVDSTEYRSFCSGKSYKVSFEKTSTSSLVEFRYLTYLYRLDDFCNLMLNAKDDSSLLRYYTRYIVTDLKGENKRSMINTCEGPKEISYFSCTSLKSGLYFPDSSIVYFDYSFDDVNGVNFMTNYKNFTFKTMPLSRDKLYYSKGRWEKDGKVLESYESYNTPNVIIDYCKTISGTDYYNSLKQYSSVTEKYVYGDITIFITYDYSGFVSKLLELYGANMDANGNFDNKVYDIITNDKTLTNNYSKIEVFKTDGSAKIGDIKASFEAKDLVGYPQYQKKVWIITYSDGTYELLDKISSFFMEYPFQSLLFSNVKSK